VIYRVDVSSYEGSRRDCLFFLSFRSDPLFPDQLQPETELWEEPCVLEPCRRCLGTSSCCDHFRVISSPCCFKQAFTSFCELWAEVQARIYYINVQHVYLILDHQPSFQSSQLIRYDLYVSSSHRRFATPYGSPVPKFNRSVRVVPPEVACSRSLTRPL
jgi:hypothetical protein